MRFQASIVLVTLLSAACVVKDPRPQLEENLRTAMQTYLYSEVHNDSSQVKYRVESVIYYDDPRSDTYICDFTVNMKTHLSDTTGVMHATVSKDFKTVKRTS